jgi:hypothetical protein
MKKRLVSQPFEPKKKRDLLQIQRRLQDLLPQIQRIMPLRFGDEG